MSGGFAVLVAVRAPSSISATSPKWSPCLSVPTSAPWTLTVASPSSMMKKPMPVAPSLAIVSPALNCRSFIVLARPWSSFLSRSANSGTCLMSSSGAAMRRIVFSDGGWALGLDGFDPAGELLDTALRRVELGRADGIELLPALPQRDRLVEARLSALEPLDDRLQLALGVL